MPHFGMSRPQPARPALWRRLVPALAPALAAGFLGGVLASHLIH